MQVKTDQKKISHMENWTGRPGKWLFTCSNMMFPAFFSYDYLADRVLSFFLDSHPFHIEIKNTGKKNCAEIGKE